MPVTARISTKGLDLFLAAIVEAGNSIDSAADAALMAGGGIYEKGMKQRVRKDTHNLEEAIEIEGPNVSGGYHFIEIGLIDADAETARYGTVNEYGSSSMPPQSFIRATVDQDKAKANKAIKESLKASGVVK